ncbi:GNAT family N-acetyltransferase [Paenibacillus sp. CECT 9249]|uniref:GNAT family N-acetyltransferase n=1 Tax=unclassified Paenibacillus TaxID=185978 RepID=UPI001C1137F8|nr:GNAT family protein [Paenibacillus sp. CECT 9249]MBU5444895.1 GNAT family N-acetyltransferase [Paenibacillus sp. MSJ-34]CAH0121751.1 Spermidine N(1)-acetyltransferase [Paenibacillus sp. CECT 9249]
MLFETDRIKFRKMTAEDAELYHSWRNDMEVMQTTSPLLDMHTLETTRDFVNHVILGSDSAKSYMIVDKASGAPIGVTSLTHIDYKNRNAECILDIGAKRHWGKGYGTEALRLLLDYAFLEMNLHRVSLCVFSFNERAVKLYEKIGFKQEGITRQSLFRNGGWHDLIHMGILQTEYARQ